MTNNDKIEKMAAAPRSRLSDFQVSQGPLQIQKRGEYFNHDRLIKVAGPTDPINPDSPVYNREQINNDLGQNAEFIQVINRSEDDIYVRESHFGTKSFNDETVLEPHDTKNYENIYELRLRSPTSGALYTITEFYTELDRCCPVSVSGDIVQISGQSVVTTVNISGIAVEISGDIVQISGQAVTTSVSGDIVQISGQAISTSVSGDIIQISGQAVATSVSGDIVQISGQAVSTSVSGNVISTSVSGNVISTSVSGNVISTSVSGNIVSTSVSGNVISTSVSGNIVLISGQAVTIAAPSSVVNTSANPLSITGASGGVALSSGVTVSVVMKAISTNSGDIYVGGSVGRPFSGFGYILSQGDTLSLDINNFNAIYVCAAISGDRISYIGID